MNHWIDWDSLPEIMTKDQFYQVCHISKQTARYLLQSGKVPCIYSGKQTRCYKIKKSDVQEYLCSRGIDPEQYKVPAGWPGRRRSPELPENLSPEALQKLRDLYARLLADYPDVLTAPQVVSLTGYAKTTVNDWCSRGRVPSFLKNRVHHIPKTFLLDFFCSEHFRKIPKKSKWHRQTLLQFVRQLKKEEGRGGPHHG